MSFADMDKKELLEVAEIFGIETDARRSPENIRATILDDGITWEMYQETLEQGSVENVQDNLPPEPEPSPVEEVKTTQRFNSKNSVELLKMERWNPTFQIFGYTFTREHPFVLVKPDEASWIMAHEDGFRVATPEEAEAFYK